MNLIISKFGTSLVRKEGCFQIRHKDGKKKLSADKISSITLGPGVKISSDAVLLALNHEIDILFVDRSGQPQGRFWSHKYGSIATVRKRQLQFAEGQDGSRWALGCIVDRLNSMKHMLSGLKRDRPAKASLISQTIGMIDKQSEKIASHIDDPLTDTLKASVRGWEGSASKTYFHCMGKLLPGLYTFEKRSRRPAQDLFNVSLNYLYGILYGRIELALIQAGLDPYIGVFHRDEYNRPVMVYDMIEKYRIWAEQVLLQLCFRRALDQDMCRKTEEGGYWLESTGRRILIMSMNDYLAEVVQLNGKRRSRQVHLQEDCRRILGRED